MLLSRFWYLVLALLLGGAAVGLFLAQSMYNRSSARAMGQGLTADGQVVSWYLKNDARERSAQLIKFALDPEVAKQLGESNKHKKVPDKVRDKLKSVLSKINQRIPKEQAFDAVFAIDQHGRVVAYLGYEDASGMQDFELGGYPVVADALHGYIRDDTLVLNGPYRVVARPVEQQVGQAPAGAVIGARRIDNRFAFELSKRTGAAIAFYIGDKVVALASPEDFDKTQLDLIMSDLPELGKDEEYRAKGRSGIRVVGKSLGVQYARLPGEAYQLDTGYAVGRVSTAVDSPFGFFTKADDKDQEQSKSWLVVLIALGAGILGIGFTLIEHTKPLSTFKREAVRMAAGEVDQMTPSKFRGVYRKIAAELNDGIDKVAAKGGVPRGAANLEQVLGDLPAEPQMSAFSLPGEAPPPSASAPNSSVGLGPAPLAPPARPAPPRRATASKSDDAEWRGVYEEFVELKKQCGEPTEGFTYEKFEQTLQKNEQTLKERHGASSVKFSVYIKDGKAKLKASPIKA